ncbi:glycosyltransferase family 2 protein [Lentilactobacillus curieae]|uniref:glycosyltransferase family 2 protein n=1 Tax=Lentilactobacillus curieae TaxID=1138822 RepID=UPI00068FFE35|nr:glycosyltransferase family 2 protein [Lentilactobacillus curieae]
MDIHKSRSTFVFVVLTIIGLSILYLSYFLSQDNEIAEVVWWGIKIVASIIAVWTYILIFYYMFLSIIGYGKVKRDYEMHDPKLKFLIMVPAHNEEAVISETIKHLRTIDYPSELYNVVVVSDQSTDSTTAMCIDMDVDVVDTAEGKHERFGVGKPAGLQYALEDYDYHQYDYVMVLDADNFVDPNVFQELNSQLIEKKIDAVQVYLDSKNTDKFQPLGYAASYWTMNRAFQLAKYRLHLPNSIGGTGFVVSTEWLDNNNGFKSHSLTEDLEM